MNEKTLSNAPITRFILNNFLELIRIVSFVIRRGWYMSIIGNGEKNSFVVVACASIADEIRNELK